MPLSEYNKCTRALNEKIRGIKNKDKDFLPDEIKDTDELQKKYLQKKISNKEYLYLLNNTLNKIIVYPETVVFDTKFGCFEHERKIFMRRKGIEKRCKILDV